jgi:hypothetical protein
MLRNHLTTIKESFFPKHYKELISQPLHQAIKYFFVALTLGLIIMFLFLIPLGIMYINSIESKTNNLSQFVINISVQQKDPVVFTQKPLIVLDLSKENKTDEHVLINEHTIIYDKFFIFGQNEIQFRDYANLLQNMTSLKRILYIVFIALLPSLFFVLFIYFTIKYLAIALIASILGYFIVSISKQEIKYLAALKIALYATTLLILLDIVILPFYFFILLPVIAYAIFYGICIWLVSEKNFKLKTKESKKDE